LYPCRYAAVAAAASAFHRQLRGLYIRQPWAIVLERSALLLLLLLDRAEMSNMIGTDLNLSEIELPSNVACKETFNRLLSQNALW
jgi:hypothetical protein